MNVPVMHDRSFSIKRQSHLSKILSCLAIMMLTTAMSSGQEKTETFFFEGFEGGDFKAMGKELGHSHSAVVVRDTARSGDHSVRFTLHRNDKDVASSKRAELVKHGVADIHGQTWAGHSVLLPEGYQKDPNFEIIFQWHERPDWDRGEGWRSPPVYIVIEDGEWRVRNRWDPKLRTVKNNPRPEGGTESFSIGKVETGVWTDFVIRTFWSHKSDGILQVWKDGSLVVNKRGPVMYNDIRGPYYKIGIYKPPFKYSKENHVKSRTFYVDDISIVPESKDVAVQQSWSPRLNAIMIGGRKLDSFDPQKLTYEIELSPDTPLPQVKARARDRGSKVTIRKEDVAAGSFVVSVTDGSGSLDYVVTFVNPSPKLGSVKVEGRGLEGFDPDITSYDIFLEEGEPLPRIEAEALDDDISIEKGSLENGNVWVRLSRGNAEETYWFIFRRK